MQRLVQTQEWNPALGRGQAPTIHFASQCETFLVIDTHSPPAKARNVSTLFESVTLFFSIGVCLILCSCATPPQPLMDRSEKGEIGFKFSPPQGPDWYLHAPAGFQGYSYARKIEGLELRSPKHSAILLAQYGFIDFGNKPLDVLKKVQEAKEVQLLSPRWTVKKKMFQTKKFHSSNCLAFDSLVLDKQTNQDMTLTGIFCLHPNDPKRYIDLSYSQRYDLDRRPIDLKTEGSAFIESLKFEPIGR